MLEWQLKEFSELSLNELYAILQLRQQVFVVEQQAIYLDADGADLSALHLMLWEHGALIAYARILSPEAESVHFGRVCVRSSARHAALGTKLVQQVLAEIKARYGAAHIVISAQQYLREFYQKLGFVALSAGYVTEDGIPHLDMQLAKVSTESA